MSLSQLRAGLVLTFVVGAALTTGGCGVPLSVSVASYAADGALMVASDKTSTDHVASVVTKQDCAMWRILRRRQMCKEREGDQDPYSVEYNEPQRFVSESGAEYVPPLRTAPGSPGQSWDPAVYKSVPTPPVTPQSVMAVAEQPPEPVAAAAPIPAKAPTPEAVPAKNKKAKAARSARKPSRGRVASAR